jgi:hypothetical protein
VADMPSGLSLTPLYEIIKNAGCSVVKYQERTAAVCTVGNSTMQRILSETKLWLLKVEM